MHEKHCAGTLCTMFKLLFTMHVPFFAMEIETMTIYRVRQCITISFTLVIGLRNVIVAI